MKKVIQRQQHGIKAEALTITLPGDEMARLRGEALDQHISTSRRVVDLIRQAWGEKTSPEIASALPAPEIEVGAARAGP